MNPLTIAETTIRQDAQGRYCLNDLHRAGGDANRHRPSLWLANKQTKALVDAMNHEQGEAGIPASPITSKKDGPFETRGTYIVKELVYAYAMWISPAFNLKVIRAYDALVTGEYIQPNIQHENYWFARRPLWPTIRARVLAGERYRDIASAIGRSVGSVARAVRRMIEVGLLNPLKVAEYQRGPARLAAQRRASGWGSPQLSLFP